MGINAGLNSFGLGTFVKKKDAEVYGCIYAEQGTNYKVYFDNGIAEWEKGESLIPLMVYSNDDSDSEMIKQEIAENYQKFKNLFRDRDLFGIGSYEDWIICCNGLKTGQNSLIVENHPFQTFYELKGFSYQEDEILGENSSLSFRRICSSNKYILFSTTLEQEGHIYYVVVDRVDDKVYSVGILPDWQCKNLVKAIKRDRDYLEKHKEKIKSRNSEAGVDFDIEITTHSMEDALRIGSVVYDEEKGFGIIDDVQVQNSKSVLIIWESNQAEWLSNGALNLVDLTCENIPTKVKQLLFKGGYDHYTAWLEKYNGLNRNKPSIEVCGVSCYLVDYLSFVNGKIVDSFSPKKQYRKVVGDETYIIYSTKTDSIYKPKTIRYVVDQESCLVYSIGLDDSLVKLMKAQKLSKVDSTPITANDMKERFGNSIKLKQTKAGELIYPSYPTETECQGLFNKHGISAPQYAYFTHLFVSAIHYLVVLNGSSFKQNVIDLHMVDMMEPDDIAEFIFMLKGFTASCNKFKLFNQDIDYSSKSWTAKLSPKAIESIFTEENTKRIKFLSSLFEEFNSFDFDSIKSKYTEK